MRLRAEVVVVGSGAGGGAAARELALAGRDVLLLEMGEHHDRMNQREEVMIPRLFQDGGGRMTVDGCIGVLQGKGVGGSTVHNLNLCKRVAAPILARWEVDYALEGLAARLEGHYAEMERLLRVSFVRDDQVNRANALFSEGCRALGLRQARLMHNRTGCVGSGFCELGCAYDAKNNSAKILIPEAIAAGARLLTGHRVTAVRSRWGRVTGVEGLTEAGERFVVEAKAVVLAASATASTALVLASGLTDRRRRSGLGLHLHPGSTVVARFEEPVLAWKGVPQSVECTELLDPTDPARRVWILPGFAHPAGSAGLMTGFGDTMVGLLQQFRYLAASVSMLHDYGAGSITATRDGRPRIHYRLDPEDGRAMARSFAMSARLWLAAGARSVWIPGQVPVEVRTMAEAERLEMWALRPFDPPLVAVHPMGGLAMSGDPEKGPTDPDGRHRGAQGLYVADGSLFPTSMGGPPQLTIYALGRMVGQVVAAEL